MTNTRVPVYNIKAVSRLVGLLPVTLRAWERRYGLPSPHRGEQGYRLYSEHDLRTLRWLKQQIDSGLSISRAVDYLHDLRNTGQDPAEFSQSAVSTSAEAPPASVAHLSNELLSSLVNFNEKGSADIMRRAFALYSVDTVLTEIVQPVLVEIGEAWHRGDLPIATEHYATQYVMQNLMSMLAASAPPVQPGAIVAACAPGEMHQIGILMLVVMLRWRGWDVKYLGPDLKLDRLEEALRPIRPRMLLFTATRVESAQELLQISQILHKFPDPQPLVVLGGQGFADGLLPDQIPAVFLNARPSEIVEKIEELLQSTEH